MASPSRPPFDVGDRCIVTSAAAARTLGVAAGEQDPVVRLHTGGQAFDERPTEPWLAPVTSAMREAVMPPSARFMRQTTVRHIYHA
jgi:hypothetical protein